MILPNLETSVAYFSDKYFNARQGWLDAVETRVSALSQRRWQPETTTITHPLLGPDQEVLATDVVWLGPRDADKVGVFLSATHGIEGYAGSAVQRFLLDSLSKGPEANANTAVLFVHALNPWGMAFKRRCDEQGIDLNRNYIDFSHPPENPGYRQIKHCFAIADKTARQQALQALATSMGKTAYEVAVSGGQYCDEQGPFFGGTGPSHGHRVCQALIDRYQLADKHLVVIDIHSGLGAWAYGEMISDHPPDDGNDRLAHRLFGPGVTNPARGNSSSVAKYGLQDYFWHRHMHKRGCFLTLEYGSYSVEALFDVIIDDHRVWAECPDPRSDIIQEQQVAMLRHFCPDDAYWRQLVLLQAAQVLQRLLTGFNTL